MEKEEIEDKEKNNKKEEKLSQLSFALKKNLLRRKLSNKPKMIIKTENHE